MPPRKWSIAGRALRSGVALSAALAVAPAAAGAATHELRPDGQTVTGFAVAPVGTQQWDALNDSVVQPALPSTTSDYLTTVTNTVSQTELTMQTAAIPAGESVTGATAWVYAQTGTVRNLLVWVTNGSVMVGNVTIPANSPAGWYQVPITVPLTQAQVDALRVGFTHNGNTGTHTLVYAAYVQLVVSDPPPPPPPDDPPVEDPPPPPPPEDPPVEDPPPPPPPDDPPVEDPPVEDPPVEDPPVEDPPVVDPPVVDPPVVDPPTLPPLDPPTLPPVDPGVTVPPIEPVVVDTPVVPPVVPPVKPPETEETLEPALAITGKNPTASPTGVVPVTVGCPETEVDGCEGTMWLEESLDSGSANQGIRSARRSPKRFSKPKRYKVKQGKKLTVPIQLDRRVHRKFKKKRSFKVTVVAQQKDSTSGTTQTMRRTVRVFNSRKKKR